MSTDDRLPLCDDDWHYLTPPPAGGCPACAGLRWTLVDAPPSGPNVTACPSWCDRTHGAVPAHAGQIGDDIELTAELAIGVFLFRSSDEPTVVNLMIHTPDETSFTKFSLLEASILSDLIREGLGLAAREAGLR